MSQGERDWRDRAKPHGTALRGVVLAWGVQAIVTQSILVREALVLMFGSEFAWGVVLFAWLFGVAVGGPVGGRLADRVRRPHVWLAVVLMLLTVGTCTELWWLRGARGWLGIAPGEFIPLTTSTAVALLIVSPVSLLVGVAFPLACRAASGPAPSVSTGVGPLGHVYAWESAGSLIGGAAFSFWAVDHLASIETIVLCGAVCAAALALLLAVSVRNRTSAFILALVSGCGIAMVVLGGDRLNEWLVQRRWADIAPGYALVAEADSRYQNLAVLELGGQYSLFCDGHVVSSFPDPHGYGPLAHFWCLQHPAPRRVLVLGGGVEGLLVEVLRHPVERVDYVEVDPRQIELIEPFLTAGDRAALVDSRVTVHHADARYYVKTQRDRFDLVIARLPEPTSALRARFYTVEFFRELRRAMTDRAVLCMTVTAAPGELPALSGEYVGSVRAALRAAFPQVAVSWGDPAHVFAATSDGLFLTDIDALTRRFDARGVATKLFHPLLFEETLDPDKLAQRERELDAVPRPDISTDLKPTIYIQRLDLWDRMTGDRATHVVARLRSIGWACVVAALLAAGGLTWAGVYVMARVRGGGAERSWVSSGAVLWSVATTGFATMALSLVWLFAFQNLYGYVYQRIGWIIAVFMGGLVLGCRLAAGTVAPGRAWRRLIGVDLGLAALALAIPFVLPALGAIQDTRVALALVEWAVLSMVALTGVLGGASFALAGGLQLRLVGRVGAASGGIVGADHAGGCVGALVTGVLLVPIFGTAATAYLLVGLKVTAAVMLVVGWWAVRGGAARPSAERR